MGQMCDRGDKIKLFKSKTLYYRGITTFDNIGPFCPLCVIYLNSLFFSQKFYLPRRNNGKI